MGFLGSKNYLIPSLYIILCLAISAMNNPVLSQVCEFPAIFNFGDSNSDTGAFSAALLALPLPYGETYFHKPAGRFSDGRLIIDFLANNLSLPFVSSYLNSLGANYSYGADFSVAGSTVLLTNATLPIIGLLPFYLAIELNQFTQFKSRSQSIRNDGGVFANLLPPPEYFSEALYTIDIGQNDIGDALITGKSVQEVKDMVPKLIASIYAHVVALGLEGARYFWIHNTGPIGCLPYVLTPLPLSSDQYDSAGCGKPFNEISQLFNKQLKDAVVNLRFIMPFASITYVDIYSIKYSFFSQPEKYGFVEPLKACCGIGGTYNYDPVIPCGLAQSCLFPALKAVWDGTHYTDKANSIVFDQIATGNFSDPRLPPTLACRRSAINQLAQHNYY